MGPDEVDPKSLQVTAFGEFVTRYSTATPVKFWRDLAREVERLADIDADWIHALHERIDGLSEFLRRRRDEGAPDFWRKAGE